MKKYYLSLCDREIIVNAILTTKDVLKKELEKLKPQGQPLEIYESRMQQYDQLYSLLKINEAEL